MRSIGAYTVMSATRSRRVRVSTVLSCQSTPCQHSMSERSPASAKKRPHADENVFEPHHPTDTPPATAKRTRRRALFRDDDPELIASQQRAVEERKLKDMQDEVANQQRAQEALQDAKQKQDEADIKRVKAALAGIKAEHGFTSLWDFIAHLFATRDSHVSSQMTKLVDTHGTEMLDSMHKRSPEVVTAWATGITMEAVASEGSRLAQLLRPQDGSLSAQLAGWSLASTLAKAKEVAPTIYQLLQAAGSCVGQGTVHKDRDIVSPFASCISW